MAQALYNDKNNSISDIYSAGGSKGPARPLGGVRGVPTILPTLSPEAAREKKT